MSSCKDNCCGAVTTSLAAGQGPVLEGSFSAAEQRDSCSCCDGEDEADVAGPAIGVPLDGKENENAHGESKASDDKSVASCFCCEDSSGPAAPVSAASPAQTTGVEKVGEQGDDGCSCCEDDDDMGDTGGAIESNPASPPATTTQDDCCAGVRDCCGKEEAAPAPEKKSVSMCLECMDRKPDGTKPCCDDSCISRIATRDCLKKCGPRIQMEEIENISLRSSSPAPCDEHLRAARSRFSPVLEAVGCICRALFALNLESCCKPGTGKTRASASKTWPTLDKAYAGTTAKMACEAACCAPTPVASSSKAGKAVANARSSCDDDGCCGPRDAGEGADDASCADSCCEKPAPTAKVATLPFARTSSNHGDVEKGLHTATTSSSPEHVVFAVSGMTCSGCETKLVRSIGHFPAGVVIPGSVKASLVLARVEFDVLLPPAQEAELATVGEVGERLARMTGFEFERVFDTDQGEGGGCVVTVDVVVPKHWADQLLSDGERAWPDGVVAVSAKATQKRGLLSGLLSGLARGRRNAVSPAAVGKVLQVAYDASVVGSRDLIEGCVLLSALPNQPPPPISATPSAPVLVLAPLVADPSLAAGRRHVRSAGLTTLLSALLTIPVLVLSWAPLDRSSRSATLVYASVSLALATAVQLLIAGPFYPLALRSLVYSRVIEMDLLVVLSTTAAYSFSVVAFALDVRGTPLTTGEFFETSTLLVTLIVLGRWVAALARQRAVESISVRSLQTPTTLLVTDTGTGAVREIDARLLQLDDIFRTPPATRLVTDGVVVSGAADVDESMLTGESLPLAKFPGASVVAGTVNVGPGSLDVRLTRLPGSNTVSAIASMVDGARLGKPKVQDLADRVAGWFVPVVCALTLLTFFAWLGVGLHVRGHTASEAAVDATTYAIAVLVVSCPCAVGLAVPMVVVIAGGVGADRGVVVKSADVIEQARKATHVMFDKTGTLTRGKMEVVGVEYFGDEEARRETVAAVSMLLQGNRHPVSRAVIAHLSNMEDAEKPESSPLVTDVKSHPGLGVEGTLRLPSGVAGTARAGNATWLQASTHPFITASSLAGHTTLCVALATTSSPASAPPLRAIFALHDVLRPESLSVVSDLRRRGIAVHMVSGDDDGVVRRVAGALGIEHDRAKGRCAPADKAEYVRALLGEAGSDGADNHVETGGVSRRRETNGNGKQPVVLFVGDGTNDAVALAAATVGVHVSASSSSSSSSDPSISPDAICQSAADVVILRSGDGSLSTSIPSSPSGDGVLTAIPLLLDLSSAAFRRIVFNFSWAGVYNVFAVLLAGGAFVSANGGRGVRIEPAYAGLGEIVSVLPVVGAAVALRWVRLGDKQKVKRG